MNTYNLLKELRLYTLTSLITEEEKEYVENCEALLLSNPFCFERTSKGHFTGSAWIVNSENSHVLLTHHKKLNKWLQLGGHADGDSHIKQVALKEAQEESGTTKIDFLLDTIFDVDIHPIPSACERHYDIIYLLQTHKDAQIIISEESHDLRWIKLEDIEQYTQERSLLRKLDKLRTFIATKRNTKLY
ncbi:NUDIX hydrolase [Candidatus Dependentiae bacterium]|nr:NUDIX hydrolase [Candidatus Dependentiae bacterium]